MSPSLRSHTLALTAKEQVEGPILAIVDEQEVVRCIAIEFLYPPLDATINAVFRGDRIAPIWIIGIL
jgi:hypothetical protein